MIKVEETDKDAILKDKKAKDSIYSAIENANSKFSLRALVNIAVELELSIDYLVFDSETPKVFESEIKRTLSDCSEQEARMLLFLLKYNKIAIRKSEE